MTVSSTMPGPQRLQQRSPRMAVRLPPTQRDFGRSARPSGRRSWRSWANSDQRPECVSARIVRFDPPLRATGDTFAPALTLSCRNRDQFPQIRSGKWEFHDQTVRSLYHRNPSQFRRGLCWCVVIRGSVSIISNLRRVGLATVLCAAAWRSFALRADAYWPSPPAPEV